MSTYDHIQIERQDIVLPYKGRFNPNAPKPPIRIRKQHGQKLKKELSEASESILASRRDCGIQTDKLMVLEIASESLSNELLEILASRFRLDIVDESSMDNDNKSKIVVQFEDYSAIDEFNNERSLWEEDSRNDSLLSYAKRRDLFSCIDSIRCLNREDRVGRRLREFISTESAKKSSFIVNIDIWYNNDRSRKMEIQSQVNTVLGTQGSRLLGDLFEISGLMLGRARVNEFTLNALLNMDIICLVDLPFECIDKEYYHSFPTINDFTINNTLDDSAPLATILDSGVFTGNPLLKDVVVAEEDFDRTEGSTTDNDGHGTGVAGIVVYGDVGECVSNKSFTPLVRICNAKVMHYDEEEDCPKFTKDERPEKIVKEAITYYFYNFGCRIFNLSAGNIDNIYSGGRQFPWASMLDDLARELDIVIVISAGNVSEPEIREFSSREEFMINARNQLFDTDHRLIDPATSALNITVGSITRKTEPAIPPGAGGNPISAGKKDYPSVFTRIGKGVNKAIKPDFVDYGGNFSLRQIASGDNRWNKHDKNLVELTLNHTTENVIKGYCGTSFSAPHVTHIVARLERALEKQLHKKPSANLIRAMLVNSASCTDEMIEWGEASKDKNYTGLANPKHERMMRLYGYGKVSDKIFYSSDNSVTMFSEDRLSLRDFHLYKIPVPKEFINVKADKSITVSLAYNPITQMSRKEYLANNLWIEVFRRIDEETLINYKAKREKGIDTEDDFNKLPDAFKTSFVPGYDSVQKSTLQLRRWSKSSMGGKDLAWDDKDNPYIYILVSGKERFKYSQQEQPQSYAICVTFSYNSYENIDLYSRLRNSVRLKETETIKTRIKV